MIKYEIVEFQDGKFAVRKLWFFGLFESFVSKNFASHSYSHPTRVELFCKCKTYEEAKEVLNGLTTQNLYTLDIKRVIND